MTIDHIDAITLTPLQIEAHTNELRSLGSLSVGLTHLYGVMLNREAVLNSTLDPTRVHTFMFGPPISEGEQSLLACCFEWYALSVSKFVRTIGWIASGRDSEKAKAYALRIIPSVEQWRNKVAAHFAKVDPRTSGKSKDTDASMDLSVMPQLGYQGNRFFVPGFGLSITNSGTTSTSGPDMVWSLTHTHEELSKRYWPVPASADTDTPNRSDA